MSKIVEIKAKIYDLHALRAAVKRLGGELIENAESYRAYYNEKPCKHKAVFENDRLELGILEENGEYKFEYDHMLDRTIGNKAGKLLDAYNMEKSYGEAILQGYIATEYLEKDGTHVLEIDID